MQEDEFHKLADETIHDLLEKLEVVNPLCYGLQTSQTTCLVSIPLTNTILLVFFRSMVTPFRWMVST